MKHQSLNHRSVRLIEGFWEDKAKLVAQVVLPYQWKALNDLVPGAEPSHAIENFRIAAHESTGDFAGNIFQDSDVAKWIEAACYSLVSHPDDALAANVEEAIRLVGKVQEPDGYINTWFTIRAPEKRWTDLVWGHELYCGGHLIEAAVAHFQTTGKRHFLEIMMRYADGLIPVFGPGGSHDGECSGHPEIELALMRLWEITGEKRYFDLSKHFMDVRGRDPNQFVGKIPLGFLIPDTRWFAPDYFQAHSPVCDQHHADGHAVRAMYLFNAMTQEYRQTRNPDLKRVLDDLWNSTVGRRMYLSGGLGSQAHAERFTIDWDLPPDTAYSETCASIGLVFWAWQLLLSEPKAVYADIIERVLYNVVLSGMALDGEHFFYVNPLESIPEVVTARQDHEHVKTERVAWFGCSCCPPNIARTVASVAQFALTQEDDDVWIHQYIATEAHLELPVGKVVMTQKTDFPWNGKIHISFDTAAPLHFAVHLRIPDWSPEFTCLVNGLPIHNAPESNGYLAIDRKWSKGDVVELELDMSVRFIRPNSRISELAGRISVMRGPLLFSAEEIDNGKHLYQLILDPDEPVSVIAEPELMGKTLVLKAKGFRETDGPEKPYYTWNEKSRRLPVAITLIPFHQWGNRAPSQEMRVWLRGCERGHS